MKKVIKAEELLNLNKEIEVGTVDGSKIRMKLFVKVPTEKGFKWERESFGWIFADAAVRVSNGETYLAFAAGTHYLKKNDKVNIGHDTLDHDYKMYLNDDACKLLGL